MDIEFRQRFRRIWNEYFRGADLPIVFFYSDHPHGAEIAAKPQGRRCLYEDFKRVREGTSLALSRESIGCEAGKHFVGFSEKLRPDLEYFLSCGIEGEMEGERYKKTPQLAAEMVKRQTWLKASARYIIFKRWDALDEADEPAVVIFFVGADALAGLFTLANFDEADLHGVIAPMGSGCSSTVHYPLVELQSRRQRPVLGTFDVSARPHVDGETLTFSVPWPKFVRMVDNVPESFLTTRSWGKLQSRMPEG